MSIFQDYVSLLRYVCTGEALLIRANGSESITMNKKTFMVLKTFPFQDFFYFGENHETGKEMS